MPLRRSTRERRSIISDDYVVYLQEHDFDMGLEDDPISVSQVKQSSDSEKWIEAMKDEMKSMKDNGGWDLVGDTPIAKGDKFSLHQCPKNELKKKDMERFPYALAIGSLMYAQVCMCSDIAYIVGMLGRYLSNPGMDQS